MTLSIVERVNYPGLYNWNTISIVIIAKACANTRARIIAVNILGALEGFLPRALMLAKALAANTAHGPMIVRVKMIISAILRLMFLLQ